MKEYAMFGIVVALLAGLFYGEISSGVARAITGITAVVERAVPQ